MNVVFRLPTEALEDKFVAEAKKRGWSASRATAASAASACRATTR